MNFLNDSTSFPSNTSQFIDALIERTDTRLPKASLNVFGHFGTMY
jgi:hypothetical protein